MDALRLLETFGRLEAACRVSGLSDEDKLILIEDVERFVPPVEFVAAKGIHAVLINYLNRLKAEIKGVRDGKDSAGRTAKAAAKRKAPVSRKGRKAAQQPA